MVNIKMRSKVASIDPDYKAVALRYGSTPCAGSRPVKSVLIISDIEGSSGCWSCSGSSFMTEEWYRACVEMTRDVNAVATTLFDGGVGNVTVQNFHHEGAQIFVDVSDIHGHYRGLIRLCYLTPLVEKILPYAFFWYRLRGQGLEAVRQRLKRKGLPRPNP